MKNAFRGRKNYTDLVISRAKELEVSNLREVAIKGISMSLKYIRAGSAEEFDYWLNSLLLDEKKSAKVRTKKSFHKVEDSEKNTDKNAVLETSEEKVGITDSDAVRLSMGEVKSILKDINEVYNQLDIIIPEDNLLHIESVLNGVKERLNKLVM